MYVTKQAHVRILNVSFRSFWLDFFTVIDLHSE